jgi:hypothetical protein
MINPAISQVGLSAVKASFTFDSFISILYKIFNNRWKSRSSKTAISPASQFCNASILEKINPGSSISRSLSKSCCATSILLFKTSQFCIYLTCTWEDGFLVAISSSNERSIIVCQLLIRRSRCRCIKLYPNVAAVCRSAFRNITGLHPKCMRIDQSTIFVIQAQNFPINT